MISRSQMNRQLYQFGTDPRSTGGIDSIRPQFVTGPNSGEQVNQMRNALQEAQKVLSDPIGILRDLYINDTETYESVLRRLRQIDPEESSRVQFAVEQDQPSMPLEPLRESQDVPEYYDTRLQILNPEQMREEMQNPSMPGMAGGGIMTLTPRGQYGFGSFVKSVTKGITGAVKGAVDAVKKVADPVAQVLAVVPNPYQPYAQMYTAARSSGLGGKDYGGLQIGGFTPGSFGGTYGINPMQSPFKIPGSSGAGQGGIFGGFGTPSSNQSLFNLANTFAPTTGSSQEPDIFVGDEYGSMEVPEQGVWDKVVKTGGKVLGDVLDSVAESISKDPIGALEKTVKIGSSIYFGNLAKKDQERINRLKQEAYDRYMAGVAKKRGQYYGETPLEGMDVRNTERTAKDVVRRPAAYGGRIGYAAGSIFKGIKGLTKLAKAKQTKLMEQLDEAFELASSRSDYNFDDYKMRGRIMAEELSELRYGKNFDDLDLDTQVELYSESSDYLNDAAASYGDTLYDAFKERGGKANGGRIGYALGSVEEGIMAAPQIANMMGMPVGNPRQNQQGIAELDYRDEGGFVPPIGIKEREDDIPAMLSNNEFVFTADAVKNAGGGDPNVGAQKMYTLMKRLENGGMV